MEPHLTVYAGMAVLCICYCITNKLFYKPNTQPSSRRQSDGSDRPQGASSSQLYRSQGHHQTSSQRVVKNRKESNCQLDTSQREFHIFIQKIVELFKDQRQPGEYQFAVLILLPSQDISIRNLTLRTRTGVVTRPNEVTDRSSPIFPLRHDFCNFVTARPHEHTHAEVFLTNHFIPLTRYCSAQQRLQCQTILLYTWLFPCDYCKRKILCTLQSCTRDYWVILAYTSKMKDMDEGHVRMSTHEFEQAGIDVRKEKYDKFLPPA